MLYIYICTRTRYVRFQLMRNIQNRVQVVLRKEHVELQESGLKYEVGKADTSIQSTHIYTYSTFRCSVSRVDYDGYCATCDTILRLPPALP